MRIPSSSPSPYLIGFLLVEALLMAVGSVMAVYFRTGGSEELFSWRYSWHRVVLVPLVLEITFYLSDLHNFRLSRSFIWTIFRVLQATAVGTMALAAIYYLFPRLFLGRGVILMSYVFIIGLVLAWRTMYHWALTRDVLSTRLMIVGAGSMADSILEELTGRSDNPYLVCSLVDVGTDLTGRRADDPPKPNDHIGFSGPNLNEYWARVTRASYYTESEELLGLVRHHQVDLIVVAMDEKRQRMPMGQLLQCRMAGMPIVTGDDFYETIAGRILADHIRPGWLIFSPGFTTSRLRRFTKRALDLFLAVSGLILAAPLALLVAIAVRLESKGPTIYKQDRVGQNDKTFTILKFRSMTADAETHSGPAWAQENDPRVTRVGKFIRRTRLDEIPQMWNVLRGDMSFVGPRPERSHFVKQLAAELPFYRERHNVKPGITGWAQVCYPYGASVAAALEKLNYDLYYIKHSNLTLDLQILFQTFKLLITGGGGR